MKTNPELHRLLHGSPEDGAEMEELYWARLDREEQLFKQRYPYSRRFMKRYLIDLFTALKRERHPIYALLLRLPREQFAIVQNLDWRLYRVQDAEGAALPGRSDQPRIFSLAEFFAQRARFHRFDEFTIYLFDEAFNLTHRLSLERIEERYEEYLCEACERALRADRRIELTRELIREHALTRADAVIVRGYLDRYNTQAQRKLQAEYDALKGLQCIVP